MSYKFVYFLVLKLLCLLIINSDYLFVKNEKINIVTNNSPLFINNPNPYNRSLTSHQKKCQKKYQKTYQKKTGVNYSQNNREFSSICLNKNKIKKERNNFILFGKKKNTKNDAIEEENESNKKNDLLVKSKNEKDENKKTGNITENFFENQNKKLIKGEYYDVEICELLSKSFLSYANFLILNRCLCDYRDGLKTVQRRIIWSMYEINKGYDKKSYKKCARIVGEVIGKYHPHGDKSVYDALIRLAQKHHNNNLLINGYGNFGSVEYNAAAMRYTEARISDFCYDVLLDEINDENIDYIKNFDGNEKEPKVLCSKIPLLLINGCSGIAVSILTNIPSHNIVDVINASINFLINEKITNDELFNIIKGPDFSTGGIIITKKDTLRDIYNTGKGNIVIRSNIFYEYAHNNKTYIHHINELGNLENLECDNKSSKKLIIKNLPPNVKPNKLIENIITVLNERKNEHDNILSKIRDESEKNEMRIVLELRKHSQIEQIHNFVSFLLKYTSMEIDYHCNFVCIGYENSYTQFSLKSFLQLWCENRIKFIKKNYQIKNNNLQKELNIIDLYLTIQKKILDIISFLHKNQNIEQIQNYLKSNFKLNEDQIKYILSMKIQKLINIKNINFDIQKNNIIKKIQSNQYIIDNIQEIKQIIIKELVHIKNKYSLKKKILPHPQLKYKYAYINGGLNLFNLPQKNDEDNTNNNVNKFIITPKVGKKEDGQTDDVVNDKNNKILELGEKEKKNELENENYRNTYIDSIDTTFKDIYNNDDVLILITYGGYIKKIKINDKLKNNVNNIMKLSNAKYILKEIEETKNAKKRNNEKMLDDIASENDEDTYKTNKNNLNNNNINTYKIKKGILCKNKDKILVTDNLNKAYILNVSEIQTSSYDSKGIPISQLIKCSTNITGLTKYEQDKKYLIVCSENGKMKIINNDVFLKKKKKGIKLFKNKKNIFFNYCNSNDNCIVGTKNGYIIQFPLSSLKISKKNSLGNKCMNMKKDDKVVDLVSYENNSENLKNLKIIFLSKNGHGKMIGVDEIKVQKKRGKGFKIMKFKKAKKNKNNLPNKDNKLNDTKKYISDKIQIENKQNKLQPPEQEFVDEKKNNIIANYDPDELLGFKLYDTRTKKENDLLIMISDHAVLIRKNISLLKQKNRKHSSQIYAKLSKMNKLMYFDIL
ncbi:DNA gyrase subunit A, putative [Plasmodium berghei]|uniref:DNA topoisomerase (ATP-hydrolyzing) n=2 Tax=Plasmodium berghei TaxID=5821 RepID=A0A509ASA7_PLABA|nr:DNA gyrase subunit A, putative [Plasmodium berghei ANKA]CXJ22121.1 DNA gyrase subunit A, putative [Plasmodium berghei]SCM26640.1 DNA gyrase subunit A, putative [Plasmodium berghei]SCN28561.1 DNA gyrase subunit A, putative [Plasmodium berghei]SCO62750.1 DNA gyrase subunit A, putative [Plasmodium berghei]SCO64310.1 DNA gyrase subunit A, putative [Plasmodium berghei]|eukprot:XP_034424206.1 DNA gyrase subunit A, putative [Plasmodium berghei ANKA]